jgi:hypothetical protein
VPRVAKGKKAAKKLAKKQQQVHSCSTVAKLPKKKCCESKSACNRCPLRMLKEGTLPQGYTVRKRKLVTVEKAARLKAEKQLKRAGRAA